MHARVAVCGGCRLGGMLDRLKVYFHSSNPPNRPTPYHTYTQIPSFVIYSPLRQIAIPASVIIAFSFELVVGLLYPVADKIYGTRAQITNAFIASPTGLVLNAATNHAFGGTPPVGWLA